MNLRKLANILVLALSLVIFITFSVFFLIQLYPEYPEYFGNYSFYTSCKEIKQGMSISDVKNRMKSYVEATSLLSDSNIAWLMTANFDNKETKDEYKNRLIFVPNKRHVADWCVVYTNGKKVTRVAISPD